MNKTTTVIAIDNANIKIFQSRKIHRRQKVISCNIQPLDNFSAEEIEKYFAGMIASLKKIPEKPIILLPRHKVILRQFKLPTQNPQEISEMIGLQLVNNLPFGIEDITYHHHVISQDGQGYSLVLAVIINRKIVEYYQQLLEKVGIKDGILALNSFGLLNWLIYQDRGGTLAGNKTVAILNVESQYSEVCFVHNKRLYFSRDITSLNKALTCKDTHELAAKMGSSLTIYHESQMGPVVKKILIPSASDEAEPLKRLLEERFNLPVEIVSPFKNISHTPNVNKTILEKCYPFSLSSLLGSLLLIPKEFIDLSSEEVHIERKKTAQKFQAALVLALFVILIASFVINQLMNIREERSRLQRLQMKAEQLKPELEKAGEKMKLVRTFDQKLARYNFIPDLVKEFSRLAPAEISFRMLAMDKDGELTIHGNAQSHAGINDFQSRLIQSKRFHDVDLQFVTNRKIANMPVMDFKMAMKLDDNERKMP